MSNIENQRKKPTPSEQGRAAFIARIPMNEPPDVLSPEQQTEWIRGWKQAWHESKVSVIADGLADRPMPKVPTKELEWENEG